MDVQTPLNPFIQANGLPQFGHLASIPESLQLDAFQYVNEMDLPASSWRKRFDYKQFQFVSIVTEKYIIGVAIADIRYLASGFCYVFDTETHELVEQQWLKPLNMGYQTQPSSWNSQAYLANDAIQFKIEHGLWHIQLSTDLIQADLKLKPESESLPLMVCTPTAYSGWTYTQKHNALTIHGQMSVKGQPQDLSNAVAGYDFSAGYMRRETSWRWASINHRREDKSIGLNLAAGVNETGNCENVIWIDGERHLMPPVHFEFSRMHQEASWRITSQDKRIDLIFKPKNQRSEKKNFWFLKSNFRQFVGYFSGYLIDDNGIKHELDEVMGLTEDHYAKW
ncbi:DUF2804 domain-containing protein [Vibrio campbellii]|uniref:DUF2804 domain-containing protein n=1 Tax=Vibrio campbellii TaxID=680 RepID=UPI0002ADF2AF|nr:DUF2804 domain-containing protein [Vibrio campbellii]ARV74254.1 hypothetical protein A8140_16420 [Vibrio campbellii CAIM 519 = NBRC 15631 = ATCC 25920]ELU52702.1 hypothetical protein B878_06541 [Vibrio campbellii CAIM 519 = NBRC 15631 = ATCC 25920]